jgi:hypothetical protein
MVPRWSVGGPGRRDVDAFEAFRHPILLGVHALVILPGRPLPVPAVARRRGQRPSKSKGHSNFRIGKRSQIALTVSMARHCVHRRRANLEPRRAVGASSAWRLHLHMMASRPRRVVDDARMCSAARLHCCFLQVGKSGDKVVTLPELTILAVHKLLRFLDCLFLVRTFDALYG